MAAHGQPFLFKDVKKKGQLFLIPNTLGGPPETFATTRSASVVAGIQHFIVEEIRSARRLLRSLGVEGQLEVFHYYELNEHTRDQALPEMLQPLLKGEDMALISEAGLPCVADPGSKIVALAHQFQIRVHPLSGPSSILMALMASGFNGQSFTFHGYLPREKNPRQKMIRQMESDAQKGYTQIFMDAPYRNNQVMEDLLTTCRKDSMLCVAADITTDREWIQSRAISDWGGQRPDLHKRPVMFLLGRNVHSHSPSTIHFV